MRSLIPSFPGPRRLVAALTVAALALTGCGGSDDEAAAEPSAPAKPASRVIEATNGSITIPGDPRRIVGISYATGALLDVGVVPVGTTKIEEPLELTADQAATGAKITEIGAGDQINLEKVAGVTPDLIIVEGADFNWPIDKLSQIAPTLYFEVSAPSDLVSSAEKIAKAVGRDAELKKLKDAYDQRVTEIKGEYADALAGNKFTVVSTYGGGNYYLGTRTSWIGQVVDDLGGSFTKASSSTATHETEESLENLVKLEDADVILIGRSGGAFTPEVEAMLGSGSFKLLKAAKNKQVHGVDFSYADRYTTMTAVLGQIETILQGLS